MAHKTKENIIAELGGHLPINPDNQVIEERLLLFNIYMDSFSAACHEGVLLTLDASIKNNFLGGQMLSHFFLSSHYFENKNNEKGLLHITKAQAILDLPELEFRFRQMAVNIISY